MFPRHENQSEELRRHRATLEAVIEGASDAIAVVDLEGRFVVVNAAAARWFNRPASELIGRREVDFYPTRVAARIEADDARLLAEGEPRTSENTLMVGGEPRTYLARKSPLKDDRGRTIGIIGIARDVTEQRAAERELGAAHDNLEKLVAQRTKALAEANESLIREMAERRRAETERRELEGRLMRSERLHALGHMAGSIAHDFNNILTALVGNAALLRTDLDIGDVSAGRLADFLDNLEQAVSRATDVTRQLLEFSRHQVVPLEPVDLDRVLGRVVPTLRRLMREEIAIVETPREELPRVMCHTTLIEQLVFNVAINARESMSAGGTLTISTRLGEADDRHERPPVVLEVHHTGEDRDVESPPDPDRTPFVAAAPGGVAAGPGFAAVDGIVRRTRGRLDRSYEPGLGTTVTVQWPAADGGAESRPDDAAATGEPRRRAVILLCEDEPALRRVVGRLLRTSGYEVILAGDGAEAVRRFDEGGDSIDLLITDVVMPEMNGSQLADRIRRRRPSVPVLFVSGYVSHDVDIGALSAPGTEFLAKPFTRAELLARVRRILEPSTGEPGPDLAPGEPRA